MGEDEESYSDEGEDGEGEEGEEEESDGDPVGWLHTQAPPSLVSCAHKPRPL